MERELHIVTSEAAQSGVRRELGLTASLRHLEWLTLPHHGPAKRVNWRSAVLHTGSMRPASTLFIASMPDVCHHFDTLVRELSHSTRPLVVMGWGAKRSNSFVQCLAALSSGVREAPYVAPDGEALRRMVSAVASGSADRLIASASVDCRTLYVWSCEPKLYRVDVDLLRPLAHLSDSALKHFSVSSSGSRITWPRADVDIDLDSVRELVDEEFRAARKRKARSEAARYASAIRAMREKHGMRQTDVLGLSEREVRRIEAGERMPRFDSLEKLASAHGMATSAYLSELASMASKRKSERSKGHSGPVAEKRP